MLRALARGDGPMRVLDGLLSWVAKAKENRCSLLARFVSSAVIEAKVSDEL